MINKLKSTSGESIAETLVAVLIAALALLMLAGSVNTSSNLITQSQSKLEDYYSKNNTLAEQKESEGILTATVAGTDISESWSGVPYYELNSEDSSILGDKSLISYGKQEETEAE